MPVPWSPSVANSSTVSLTQVTPPVASSNLRSPFTNLLNLPVVRDVTTISAKTGSARVLTSDECWSLYKVKEEKKKCEAEEKEKRKQERERKKREKEIEQRRKAEERIRRTEEKEKKRKQAEEEKEKKRKQAEEEKAKKSLQHKAVTGKKRSREVTTETSTNEGHLNLVEGGSKITSRRTLHKRSKVTMNSSIFTDLCCVCFSSFEEDEGTGREWLQYICSRWIHEDCVVPNPNGENIFVPYVEL